MLKFHTNHLEPTISGVESFNSDRKLVSYFASRAQDMLMKVQVIEDIVLEILYKVS